MLKLIFRKKDVKMIHFIQIVSVGDYLNEIPSFIFCEKREISRIYIWWFSQKNV